MAGEQQVGQVASVETAEGQTGGGKDREEEGSTSGRDMVFLCMKVRGDAVASTHTAPTRAIDGVVGRRWHIFLRAATFSSRARRSVC